MSRAPTGTDGGPLAAWLDPAGAPAERPPLAAMSSETRTLH
jgi:hypothetical protein